MLWPSTANRHLANPQLAQRLVEVRKQNPESERWLRLVEAALVECEEAGPWADAVITLAAQRPIRAPLLHQAQITIERRTTERWVRRLLDIAEVEHQAPLALLEAAICQDDAVLPTPELRVAAQMAALPLLQTCGREHGPGQQSWWEGYCPLCGAWPALAEFRGLERKRWLRCGRCGSGWEVPWLRCPFCDETNHVNLGYLAPEEGETARKVEVCDTCKGYVKAEPTVRSLAPGEILLDDLAMVPLEVVALERGYHRPDRPGYALAIQLVTV